MCVVDGQVSRRLCSVVGCDRARVSRGFCTMHYRRYLVTGNPLMVKRLKCCSDGHLTRWSDGRLFRKVDGKWIHEARRVARDECGLALTTEDSVCSVKDVPSVGSVFIRTRKKRPRRCKTCGGQFVCRVGSGTGDYCSRACLNESKRKMTPQCVYECRVIVALGAMSMRDIALRMGMSPATVRNAVIGKTYKSVRSFERVTQ